MADDDNFDIDIYGDDQDTSTQQDADLTEANTSNETAKGNDSTSSVNPMQSDGGDQIMKHVSSGDTLNGDAQHAHSIQQIASTGGSTGNHEVHRQAPQKQGTKRKQGEDDDRPMDPGATAALMINDVNWWVSEEDIRGWANQSGCEDELNEVTFNEHKVNGKSKGQVYVQLQSPQAATALKHQIDNLFKDQTHTKKPTAIFNPPQHNPFKTLPKDVPAREKGRGDRGSSSNYGGSTGGFNNNRGNYNRGNYNNRGGNMGYQNNRNFSGLAGGNMGGNMGYGGQAPMNNFGGNAMGGAMNNFGGGFNRGGMMGNNMRGGMGGRGGRGGMGMNNMGGGMGMNMPMGNNMMGMGGGMGGGMMGMGNNMAMMGGMNGAFPNQAGFNPAFFNQQQQQQGGNDWGNNPHGAKRPRPE
ncbi:hypothetical protein BDU57DRAFT_323841 [Ampelomyces quisqualis]|uniref:RRM domain-containing protein n=1 Tax=Ampelomyces quisqualis TaxID=50730 RepID=A0A6A5QGJ8_AMPQU|nr:hypothetical protein BDU57DRAFT_323841 [Ampelomyces quisqualis]